MELPAACAVSMVGIQDTAWPMLWPRPKGQFSVESSERIIELGKKLTGLQRQLFLYILSLVHRADDAGDILQEANRVIWEKIEQCPTNVDFAAWAFRVAYYEVLTYRKRQARTSLRFKDAVLTELADEAIDAMTQTDARRQALGQCLAKLRETDRQLITRRYLAEHSVADVAEQFGRSVKSVYQSLMRIRLALLECIERTISWENRS